MNGKITPCQTGPNCTNTVGPRARSPFCTGCQSGWHYWKHKKPSDRIKRVNQLKKLSDRFDVFDFTNRRR